MEQLSRKVIFPKLSQIIDVNRRMIEMSGGLFNEPTNFNNRNSLEYILSVIRNPIISIGHDTGLDVKAVSLGYTIIRAHVFCDGNKRTGSHMTWEFLQANKINLVLDTSIEEISLAIAKGEASKEAYLKWVRAHIEE